MTVAALAASITHNEDGVTLAFPAPFRFLDASHLLVERIAASGAVSVLGRGSDWSASGGDTDAGGTVTLTATTAGARLRIRRVTPRGQSTGFPTSGNFPARANESAFDRAMLIDQEQDDARDALGARAILVPDGETAAVLPPAGSRANLVLQFDNSGAPHLVDPSTFGKGDPGGNVESVGFFTQIYGVPVPDGTNQIRTSGYDTAGRGGARYVADASATLALATAHPRACSADARGRYFRLLPDDTGAVPAEAFRAAGDADDTTASLAAGEYAKAIGCKYVGYSGRVWTTSNAFYGYPGYMMTLPQGVYARDNGATFRAGVTPGAGQYGIYYAGVLEGDPADGVVTAPIAAGDSVIPIFNASAYEIGDYALFRLGDVAYDPAETYNHGFARVLNRNTAVGNVTLDRAAPRPFTAPDIAAAVVNRGLQKVVPITGQYLGDAIYDDNDTNSLSGMVLLLTQDCRVGTVGGRNLSVGAFIAQYSYGFHVDKIYNYDCPNTGPNTGGGCRFAEARGTVGSVILRNNDGSISCEAGSVIKYGYVEDDNYHVGARTLFQLGGRSHVDVDYVLLLGRGGQNLFDAQDNSQYKAKHAHARTATMPAYMGKLGKHITDTLTLEIGGAAPEVYRVGQGKWVTKVIYLRNGMADTVFIAPGNTIIAESRIYTSTGATAGINYLNAIRQGGPTDLLASTLVPGSWTSDANKWDICGFNGSGRGGAVSLYIDTAAAGGAVPVFDNEFLICEFWVIPEASAANLADGADWWALSEVDEHFGGAAYDPPSIAAGARVTTTVTVTGAQIGDPVDVSFSSDLQGLIMVAQVLAANTVTVSFINPTAGAIDALAGILRAWVKR